ncbi:hypothetical protein EWB00_006749 [Schistosoma japonicum]|uniref:Uncharacterized protein n=1 Tax=Schistosoma japonicum TaxID=6182 RepID=A0A4Z2CWZ8_SCHJA|nr:hypothetical protein EWB00_006749 [Schistosoma japonicum]
MGISGARRLNFLTGSSTKPLDKENSIGTIPTGLKRTSCGLSSPSNNDKKRMAFPPLRVCFCSWCHEIARETGFSFQPETWPGHQFQQD